MPEVIFSGPEGRIEGRYTASNNPNAPIVLLLHPHPLHGGTMNNKVVYTMFKTFVANGFAALRFNFRGVGKSQGKYAEGEGELTDAAYALDWLQLHNESTKNVWIAGFSFGAWVAMQLLMRRPEIERFVCVAPPVNMFDFSFLAPCPTSGIVLQGNKDTVVPHEEVDEMMERLEKHRGTQVKYQKYPGADHFFKDKEDTLITAINGYISEWDGVDNLPI